MDRFNRAHRRIAAALAVFGAALLLQGSLLAFANPPQSDTVQINDTATDSATCGFPLVFHDEGALRTSLFFDRNGQVVRFTENWQGVQSTITNPDNGRSLSYHTAGRDDFTTSRDGDFTVYQQGNRGVLTVPGHGALTGSAGNTTIRMAPDGTVTVTHSGFLRDGDFGVACDYLQGP